MTDLDTFLHRCRRRFNLRIGWQLWQRTLWIAALISLLIQLAGRLWPAPYLGLWTIAPFPLWLLIISLGWLFRLPSLRQVALRLDLELGLKERLSTALELQNPAAHRVNATLPFLITAQRTDALQVAETIEPGRDLPLLWVRKPLGLAGLLLVGVLALANLPNPMDRVLAERQAIRAAAHQEAERIDAARQELATELAQDELTPEELELFRQLQELADALRSNPGDLEQAMSDVNRLEEAFRQQLDPLTQARAANLESLATRLQALSGLKPRQDQTAAESAQAALAALAEQMLSMSQEQKEAAAQALAQLAAQTAQAGSDPALAQALSALAQAMRNGDQQAASQAAAQASQALSQAQQALSTQATLQQALAQLQSSQQALTQARQQALAQAAGQNPASNPGQQPGSSPGSSGQPGSQGSPNPGSATGQTGASGGGSNASTLPPALRPGVAGRPQGNRPGETGANLDAQVYSPWLVNPTSGNQIFIPGQDSGQGQTTTSTGQSQFPGVANPSLVPYYQVFSAYLNAANQSLEQTAIPSALLYYVQQYFLSLTP